MVSSWLLSFTYLRKEYICFVHTFRALHHAVLRLLLLPLVLQVLDLGLLLLVVENQLLVLPVLLQIMESVRITVKVPGFSLIVQEVEDFRLISSNALL